MARKAAATAVYAGRQVKVFKQDLSNYSRLRSSLSATMRAQTLTVKELKAATAAERERYIRELNIWKTTPQREKAARAQSYSSVGLQRLLTTAAKSGYFETGATVEGKSPTEDKMALATAVIKLKNMSPEQAKMELKEALNTTDRINNGGFYQDKQSYWISKYYIEQDVWDPELSNDDMLRCVVYNDMLAGNALQNTIEELISRLGETPAEQTTGYASERAGMMTDLLGMAKAVLGR